MAEGDLKPWDFLAVIFFAAWLIAFYPFILFNTQEEIDSKHQIELLGYGLSFLVLTLYGGYAHSVGKHISLKNLLARAWVRTKGFCMDFWNNILHASPLPSFLTTPARNLGRLLNFPSVCYGGNLVLEYLLYCTLFLLAGIVIIGLVCNYEFASFLQSLAVHGVYVCFTMSFHTEYTVFRLLNHVAYICAHVGYICESLEYGESHLAVHAGLSTLMLNLVWYVMNYPMQAGRNGAPDDIPAPDDPPGHPPRDDSPGHPPGDDPPDDGPSSPPDDPPGYRWKPKTPRSNKKKKPGKRKR